MTASAFETRTNGSFAAMSKLEFGVVIDAVKALFGVGRCPERKSVEFFAAFDPPTVTDFDEITRILDGGADVVLVPTEDGAAAGISLSNRVKLAEVVADELVARDSSRRGRIEVRPLPAAKTVSPIRSDRRIPHAVAALLTILSAPEIKRGVTLNGKTYHNVGGSLVATSL